MTELSSNGPDRLPGAIVLGGNFVGLGLVRSLGRRGVPTWVIDTDRKKSIAQFSRYCRRFIETTEPVHEVLLREGKLHELQGWVVFAVADDYVDALSTHFDELAGMYRLTAQPANVTRIALDKRLTYANAAELGIDVPWTCTTSDVSTVDVERITYPAILKPAINHRFFPHTNVKALKVQNGAELRRQFNRMTAFIPAEEIMIQEMIPGGGETQFSFCAVADKGRIFGSLAARRRRQYPIEFGNASTFVETAHQPVVEANGRRFMEAIGFDGMGEIEFKFDGRDGKYKILDFNPRPWGWHTLGASAGVDFAYLLWRHKVGLPLDPIKQREATWCREITDAVAIMKSHDRKDAVSLLLRAATSGRLTMATFKLTDPLPFFAELVLWISSGIRRQKKAKNFVELDPARSES
jgi:D-aspartate ligase